MRKEFNSITDIKNEIARLQRDADKLKQKTRSEVSSDILRSMKEHDLTPEDIAQEFHKSPLKTKAVSKIRYQHPDGHTWMDASFQCCLLSPSYSGCSVNRLSCTI